MKAEIKKERGLSVCARADVIEMAVAYRYLKTMGVSPTSRSEILGLSVRLIASQIPEEEWPTLDEAIQWIDETFPVKTRKGLQVMRTSKIKDPVRRAQSYETWEEVDKAVNKHSYNPKGFRHAGGKLIFRSQADLDAFTAEQPEWVEQFGSMIEVEK